MWTRSKVSLLGQRLLRIWPWLTALVELVALTSLGLLFVANELRVALSYHPQTPARDAELSGYGAYEDVSALLLRWAVVSLIPIFLGQCFGWSWIRAANADRPRIAWVMPITTLIAIVLLAFIGFLGTIAISASMVG